ncbi:uncharacterized protein LOC126329980 [Schistocerca gregaria]|uniref:uncharacterized protein LOC126329980 n=1 Tax=Schistocerca gregaria TaxID=7010 RepID=UPI00211F2FE4|nr:uncharacterized protein LOC126329980 [Schistocerca gregaria]
MAQAEPASQYAGDLYYKYKKVVDSVRLLVGSAKECHGLGGIAAVNASGAMEACKKILQRTIEFQSFVKQISRPYIAYASEILSLLDDIDVSAANVETLASSGLSTAETHILIQNIHSHRQLVSEASTEFKRWLYITDQCYTVDDESLLSASEPASAAQAKNDLISCPKWILAHLMQARRNELAVEEKWRLLAVELSSVKQKLSQSLKNNSDSKDQTIKKLNRAVNILVKELDAKTQENKRLRELWGEDSSAIFPQSINLGISDESLKSTDNFYLTPDSLKATPSTFEHPSLNNSVSSNDPPSERRLDSTELSNSVSAAKPQDHSATNVIGNPNCSNPNLTTENKPSPSSYTEVVDFAEARIWLSSEDIRAAVFRLLIDPELTFINILGQVLKAGPEVDTCAASLVTLFQKQGVHMMLFEFLIQEEVERCKSVNTLFRGEELFSRVLRAYVRSRGQEYVQIVLLPLIKEIVTEELHFELDPNRADPNTPLQENYMAIKSLASRFLDVILNSYEYLPSEFLNLCNIIYRECLKRLNVPDLDQVVASGLIFLRFICPAITSPDSFNVLSVESSKAYRTLLLVGKIIQNLANGTFFKEPYMLELNQFLEENKKRFIAFIQILCVYPPKIGGNFKSLRVITNCISKRRDAIKTVLTDEDKSKVWTLEQSTNLYDRTIALMDLVRQLDKDLVKSPETIHAYCRLFGDNEEFTVQILRLISSLPNIVEIKQYINHLLTIFCYSDRLEFFIKLIVKYEAASPGAFHQNLDFTKLVFTEYSLRYATQWLRKSIGCILNPIVVNNVDIAGYPSGGRANVSTRDQPLMPQSLKDSNHELNGSSSPPNYSSVLELTKSVFQSIISSLPCCPRHFWFFMNVLSLYTSRPVSKIFILEFCCIAIERCAQYNLVTEKPQRQAAHTLELLVDTLRNCINSQGVIVSQTGQDISKKDNIWAKLVSDLNEWVKKPPSESMDSQQNDSDLSSLADTLLQLTDWILKNHLPSLQSSLQSVSKTQYIQLKIEDLVEHIQDEYSDFSNTQTPLSPISSSAEHPKLKERKSTSKLIKKKKKE